MTKHWSVIRHKDAERPIAIMEVPEDPSESRRYLVFTPQEAWDLIEELSVAISQQTTELPRRNKEDS